MLRGNRRSRVALGGLVAVAVALAGADASAHSFSHWSGTSGPFAWQAKRLSCGAVKTAPSRIRAHSRWSLSPANGYQRLTFTRQIQDAATDDWVTVQRQRRSTKNTRLEGVRTILHWTQFFFPFEDEGGKRSRHLVRFEWLRDRPGVDRLVTWRSLTFRPCVVSL